MQYNEIISKARQMSVNTSLEAFMQKKVDLFNTVPGTLNETDGYNCSECLNRGYIAVLRNGEEIHKACKCLKTREFLKKAKESGLADVINEKTFDTFKTAEEWRKKLLEKSKNFCNDEGSNWFFIGGQNGAGKTHLCTAIAAHYLKQGKSLKYMLWIDDGKYLKAIANDCMYQEEIEKYKTADVLYIDDFLKTKSGIEPTPADVTLAFEIINARYNKADCITIISSERTLDEIIDIDGATGGRIYQRADKYRININRDQSKNYRLR